MDVIEAIERLEKVRAENVGTALKEKQADTPCGKCGHERFYVYEDEDDPVPTYTTIFCRRCGYKMEFVTFVLFSPESDSEGDNG